MTTETKPLPDRVVHAEVPYTLRRMIVAHDSSAAAEKAFKDAVELAKRFQAEVVIAHVESPLEMEGVDESGSLRGEHREMAKDIAALAEGLASEGLRSRGIVRRGAVGDVLFNLCCEESADLLLMGAYGNGSQYRQTLGSTAEQLLRAVPCPVLTYGPGVVTPVLCTKHLGPVLLPVSLPMVHDQLNEAIALAKLLGESLEVFHAVDATRWADSEMFENQCIDIARYIGQHGVRAKWSLMTGQADLVIWSKSVELDSALIILPLKSRKGLSAPGSDNVAAHLIRQSSVPVLSYRCD